MAVTLGKKGRKEDSIRNPGHQSSGSEDEQTARALFQKAFETKFKPLKTVQQVEVQPQQVQSSSNDNDADSSSNDDWTGFDQEETDHVEIVRFDNINSTEDDTRSRELKAFMSSSLPRDISSIATLKTKKAEDDDDPTETANLKNDLALQRLLKESHLLRTSSDKTSGPEMQGRDRLKALDLRMQSLGGKTSHLAQESMPLSHRRGIVAKSIERERKRRKDAADNGIVLERAKSAVKKAAPRDKGIGGPSIGQFRGGMLKLSSKDVKSIEQSRSGGQKRKRGR